MVTARNETIAEIISDEATMAWFFMPTRQTSRGVNNPLTATPEETDWLVQRFGVIASGGSESEAVPRTPVDTGGMKTKAQRRRDYMAIGSGSGGNMFDA